MDIFDHIDQVLDVGVMTKKSHQVISQESDLLLTDEFSLMECGCFARDSDEHCLFDQSLAFADLTIYSKMDELLTTSKRLANQRCNIHSIP